MQFGSKLPVAAPWFWRARRTWDSARGPTRFQKSVIALEIRGEFKKSDRQGFALPPCVHSRCQAALQFGRDHARRRRPNAVLNEMIAAE
jgi:hypothetical protein